MTLYDTARLIKKAGIGSAVGIILIIVIVILVRVGINIKNSLYPDKLPPTRTFGELPPLQFPENAVNNNFTYTLETITGGLPTELPDRLNVFAITENGPNFLNLATVKQKVASLGFTSQDGKLLPEIQLAAPYYEWDETTGFNRKIVFNINSFDFKMTSDYLSSPEILSGKFISDEQDAINVAKSFLRRAGPMPEDLDLTKTTTKDNKEHYVTFPKLYSVQSGTNMLIEEQKLSQTQVIRVDFYQKDVEYDLNTGAREKVKKKHLKLPILYPRPPFSIMSFWIASGPKSATVTHTFFTHKNIDFNKKDDKGQKIDATYSIKTPQIAYNELGSGKAYIAAYSGNETNIAITDVYLAYYLDENSQGFLMPIYIFEGKNGFFAYVSAI